MLNIYERENYFIVNSVWNVVNKDGFTIQKASNWIAPIVEVNNDFLNFEKAYEELKTKKVNIKEEDVIYFFKESKFPRFKFSSTCKNLKTIQIPKATYLVTPIVNYNNYNKAESLAFQCTLTNNVYKIYEAQLRRQEQFLKKIYNQNTFEENVLCLLRDKFVIQGDHYRMFKTRELNNSIKNFNFLNDINDNIDKCIIESNLEEYINSFNENELNEDIYKSLNNMLKSTDANTVELGIKMLNNFDIKKYALQIGSLLRLNGQNIERNKALNTVGFKNIMSQLGTNFNNIKYNDTLRYYNNLYKNTSSEEDKVIIKQYIAEEIKKRMINMYNTCMLNTTVHIDLTLEVI